MRSSEWIAAYPLSCFVLVYCSCPDRHAVAFSGTFLPRCEGTAVVTGGSATDGSVSYAFQATGPDAASSTQWVDSSGASVDSISEALSVVAQTAGYNQGTGQNPPLDSFLTFTVSASVAQGWVDNGLAGLALSTIDDGDDRSRFNFIQGDAGDNPAADTAGRPGGIFDKKQSFFR